ncbi:MAG: UvrB/uvrC motif, partial [Fibrobacterota bacterium]
QLQSRLSQAIEDERYEEAARLRDELRRLQQGGN